MDFEAGSKFLPVICEFPIEGCLVKEKLASSVFSCMFFQAVAGQVVLLNPKLLFKDQIEVPLDERGADSKLELLKALKNTL